MPLFYASVAQWIEQQFPVLRVGGSIPLGGTNFNLIWRSTQVAQGAALEMQ